ncbi:MAG TPA: MFS transporter [Algoriphagus sp.]|jgi:MFS family permease|uniref:MFS transporter n=1 Tax=unclassified Algoriphagus TaxID=2641541 RepID=UPI000C35F381|nr:MULTISPECIES: MFS transporter [unclassified Algoriphagus]MAL14511.1 MFS transporter [Algoriphagus sp.]MAN85311.1 MFS transporter [Algoriphagus sp.]QYH38163.1 MFS transporter [Algoriphagus sp. NBT04N3]HAD52804.1 MFS transporter [Algoriphagus sp.]HAH38009.1 MFS transporter [Algoriphagus sp.]|tara:strand:+ start:273 stop:1472 length:1200 start_codon:yes stop_codon:yes gene_type:complete
MSSDKARSALILIVIAQFLGTSLWFAANAAIPEISQILGQPELTAPITIAVQFGFISGTLLFAVFSIPDRFSPRWVFMVSAILASFFNLFIVLIPLQLGVLLICRFFVGFFLAGIYPVGMKIAADYFEKGLGTALGFLVGALVLGTAFPHLIRGLELQLSWEILFWTTSALAIIGGLIVGIFVPDGPFRKQNLKFEWSLIPNLSKIPALKSAASGYFGHMWELYTFWAFIPGLIAWFSIQDIQSSQNAYLSFAVIAVGAISCAVGGLISPRIGSEKVALTALLGSGICCILVLIIPTEPHYFWIIFLLIWGMLVTADSPQFSTLVAQATPAQYKGTALTLVNCLGFALTIVSIQVGQLLLKWLSIEQMISLLSIGPLFGLLLFKLFKKKKEALSRSLPA